MSDIKHDNNKIILNAFNKYLEIVKNPEEFDKRVCKVNGTEETVGILQYINPLLFFGEYLDILPKDTDWEDIIHQYMIKIKEALEMGGGYLSPSLFSGLSDIGYSIHSVYKKTGSYEKFLNTLNNHILMEVNFLLDKYENDIGNMEAGVYDFIYGFSGQGAYLLMFKTDKDVIKTLNRICRLFVNMTKKININYNSIPGWYIPVDKLTSNFDKEIYKDGNFNLSVSHGISGVLAFMALAIKEGIEVEGQKEAMNRILDTLVEFSYKNDKGNTYWSGQLSLSEYLKGESEIKKTNRQSWCYGSVGISRAMYLAGKALDNKKIIEFSSNILEGIADSTWQEWGLDCEHLCHGRGGLLSIMEIMYNDTKNDKYKTAINNAVEIMVKGYDNNSIFGFYNYTVKDITAQDREYEYVDDYSFLEGTTGTILALMASIYPDKISWMRHLIIN